MAAPNLIAATAIYGKTTAVNLTTTSATTLLSNASASGKCLKVNTVSVTNYSGTASIAITLNWNNGANLGGTNFAIASTISVPVNSTLNIVDKTSLYYLEENQSLGVTASAANGLVVTCSYEDIS